MSEQFEKFKRHINKPFEFEIEEDKFEVKPIPMEYIDDLVKVYELFEDIKEPEDLLNINQYLTYDRMAAMKTIILNSMRESYPDLDEETLNAFCVRNFWTILSAVLECNQFHQDKEKTDKALKRIEKIRKMDNVQASSGEEEKG